MQRICRERGWPLKQWRKLARKEKVVLLAYDLWRERQRHELRKNLNKDDWSAGLQWMLLAMGEL